MGILSELEPKEVFHFFEELCQIPHPSYKEEQISNYCVEFAKKRGLTVYQDTWKNVIIIKEASYGYEEREPLILQGHLDMVCEREKNRHIDFEKDALELAVDGDFVYAKGTTLGGDDGIAVAYALAVLDSDTIAHPRLEVVLTVSEEVGMEGAAGIDLSMLRGKRLLNIDSEEEGILLAGCAGGVTAECRLPVAFEEKSGVAVEVRISGLPGGHSGVEIGKGFANANVLLGRFLSFCNRTLSFGIMELEGGLKGNAIPREAKAVLCLEEEKTDAFFSLVEEYEALCKKEWKTANPGISLTGKRAGTGKGTENGRKMQEEGDASFQVLSADSAEKVLLLWRNLPNGVQKMSAEVSGMVETSLNLGIMKLDGKQMVLHYTLRSAYASAKEELLERIRLLAEYAGASVAVSGDYPAWEYKKSSALRDKMVCVYQELFGKTPVIRTIHAGLECGILAGKIKDMDAVSFGPDIYDIHTPKERLSISSVKRTWEYLLKLLQEA